MILHRLRLTNFRGVQNREICFPHQGVVVVCGPNEIGKSSMLEALDLLLSYRDRSTHRNVKQVKPANADVGAQVEAEISTGPYRFVYRKQFHKKPGTELDIIEPRREHLTADEAHERVEAMLAETLDTKLWDAQRVLQSSATCTVNLSGSDALARALDAAAGATDAAPAGGDSLLVDRVDAEYLRYFTATGRPTGAWKAAIERVRAAETEVARWRLAVEDVDQRVVRHAELTETLRALDGSLTPAAERLAVARMADGGLAELCEQLHQARLIADVATAAGTSSALANGQRQQLIADLQRRGETLVALHAELAEAEQREAEALELAEAAARAAEHATAAHEAAQQRFDAARGTARACAARDEAERLAARVGGIDAIQTQLTRITGQLAAGTLTETKLAGIERHAEAVQRLAAQLHTDAARVEFAAPADLEITVDGDSRTLCAGRRWSLPASAAVVVDVPGVLSVRIDPGASAVKLRADLDAAQRFLDQELAAAGVTDLAAARALDNQRRALADRRAMLEAKCEGLCAGEDATGLRSRLAELRELESGAEEVATEAAIAELTAADEALRRVRGEADVSQRAAAAAVAAHTGRATAATVQRDRLSTANTEFATVGEQLATVRAVVSDAAVAAQAGADAEAQRVAEEAVALLAARYAAADPAGVQAELAAAVAGVEAITAERDEADRALRDLTVELGVIGSEGRQGRLDEAQAELDRAGTEHRRIRERAEAAELLRSTMIRHRDRTRQRYVQPYRAELERLGRQVFGPSFEVDVDTELAIQTRTLDGRTIPFDSLSGGAKEQLGILARLAGAALVAREDTVPVVIDDALGFSDPDRLVKMGAVLNSVGYRGQVIVLTCIPGRYDGITDAEVIELTA